jgi:hypothetical protein
MGDTRIAQVDGVDLVSLWDRVDVEVRPAKLHETTHPNAVGIIRRKQSRPFAIRQRPTQCVRSLWNPEHFPLRHSHRGTKGGMDLDVIS